MSVQQFAKALVHKLREEITNLCTDVAAGNCPDHETYKFLCGQIQGLQRAEALVLDLAKKADQTDDDDS